MVMIAYVNYMPINVEQVDKQISVRITGNRFLRHMICRIIGAMTGMAIGQLTEVEILESLENQKDLKLKPAPGKGLTLLQV